MSLAGSSFALAASNLKGVVADPARMAVFSAAMAANNVIFFMLWVVFFGTMGQVGGWRLEDVAALYGILCLAVGTGLFFCDGARTIAVKIRDGELDGFISRPAHPLPSLLFSRAIPSGPGDALSAPFFWFLIGGLPLSGLPMLLGLALLVAVIIVASTVMYQSLGFWLRGGGKLGDQLLEALFILSTAPQQGQAGIMKIIIVTVLPAWFTGFTPVEIVRDFSLYHLLGLAAFTAVYSVVAVMVFNLGLRRYRRG